tara:strand:+ start:2862 stop:4139 length:1278 start_codon:yes stop_codon:yes gene_type:complete
METIILEDNEVLEGKIYESFDNPEVLIKVKGDNVVIRNCRFFHPKNDFECLIRIDGKNCLIESCVIGEIDVNGCCIGLSRKENLESPDYCVINSCLFMNRRSSGKNGAEAIRLGWSGTSLTGIGNNMVINNRFENWSGEIEGISVKCCNNIIFNNEMMGCESTITLRHGKNNIVSHNYIDGKNMKGSGGIRVIDSNHYITDNIIMNILGDKKNRVGITLINGKQDTEINGYYPIKNCVIINNLFIKCNVAMALGYAIKGNTELPSDIVIEDNIFDNCERIFSNNGECKGLRIKSIFNNISMNTVEKNDGIVYNDKFWYNIDYLRHKEDTLKYDVMEESIRNYTRPKNSMGDSKNESKKPLPKTPELTPELNIECDLIITDNEEKDEIVGNPLQLGIKMLEFYEARRQVQINTEIMNRLIKELELV